MTDNGGYVNDSSGVTSFSFSSLSADAKPSGTITSLNNDTHSDYEGIELDKVKSGDQDKASFHDFDEHDGPYAGMPKEVLLKYSRQAKFVWARNILTALVILTILTLIALVIAIVVISPPCLDYWQASPIYQIYPKSFRDAVGDDGYGDLKGIIEKLDYINDDLGVRAVWINPVYASPQKDNGYDISDFRDIDPTFGTMEDMDELIIEMHNRGMKLIMDFVPNHSSDKHEWFLASSNTSHPDHDKYKDYYVWVNGPDKPNNWVSEFDNASAWTWNDDRKQFYFHAFFAEQPDLNLWNPEVREEIKDILRFWLEKGVDGFRCDALAFMLEAEHLRDNPVPDPAQPVNKDNIWPDYTQNYKGVHDIVAEWRALLDEYSTEPGVYRFMETEVYATTEETVRYYGTERAPEGDLAMNFLLITADPATDWNAATMRGKILEWMHNMPEGKWANWVVSNHDNSRLPSRVGPGLARCAAVLIMTLPGTPGLYYGDEIGMTDNDDIPDQQVCKTLARIEEENRLNCLLNTGQDFRDPERTPMQWNMDDANAGFCANCTPWLPVNSDYKDGITVKNETGDQDSMLEMYKRLISLRTATVFQRGYLCMLEDTLNTLIFVRELPGLDSRLVLINFDKNNAANLDLSTYSSFMGSSGTVEFYSGTDETRFPGQFVNFDDILLNPSTGLIIEYKGDNLFNENPNFATNCFIHLKVCYNWGLGIVQTC